MSLMVAAYRQTYAYSSCVHSTSVANKNIVLCPTAVIAATDLLYPLNLFLHLYRSFQIGFCYFKFFLLLHFLQGLSVCARILNCEGNKCFFVRVIFFIDDITLQYTYTRRSILSWST